MRHRLATMAHRSVRDTVSTGEGRRSPNTYGSVRA